MINVNGQPPLPNIYFTKVRKVKNIERGTSRSAGIDFFVPEFDKNFIDDLINKNPDLNRSELITYSYQNTLPEPVRLNLFPHQRILIPSGIHVRGIEGYALFAKNKSGVSTKKGLDRLAELIDEDYQGEIHISLVNTSNQEVYIFPNDKIIQCVLIPVLYTQPVEITTLQQLYPIKTERGEGGFGSTGV